LAKEPGGAWQPAESKEGSEEDWAFTKAGDKLYQLVHTEEEGRKAAFEASCSSSESICFWNSNLTKVEGDDLKVNAWACISLVPAHLLSKVDQTDSLLKLAAVNPDWMKTFPKQHFEAIAHRAVSDGSVVLVASTDQLQRLILAHLGNNDFIGDPMEMKRK